LPLGHFHKGEDNQKQEESQMKTLIRRDGDTLVINVNGKIDHEAQEKMKENLKSLLKPERSDSVPKQIIFNMEKLEFVGSSGISAFIQTLKDFNTQTENRPRYCHVRNEFKRIIKAHDEENHFEFFENEDRAKKSFDQ
jgi:anti-anti-sigma factor